MPAVAAAAIVHLIELGIITWSNGDGYILTHKGTVAATRLAESEAAHA